MSTSDLAARHARLVQEGDAEAVADLYAEDGQLVWLDGVSDGRDAVRDRYRQFFEYHGRVSSAETTHEQTSSDAAFNLLRVESERGRFEIVNAFVFEGDHIARHFSNETEVELDRDEVEREA
jgi:ketosteroid isomerase-like protein